MHKSATKHRNNNQKQKTAIITTNKYSIQVKAAATTQKQQKATKDNKKQPKSRKNNKTTKKSTKSTKSNEKKLQTATTSMITAKKTYY